MRKKHTLTHIKGKHLCEDWRTFIIRIEECLSQLFPIAFRRIVIEPTDTKKSDTKYKRIGKSQFYSLKHLNTLCSHAEFIYLPLPSFSLNLSLYFSLVLGQRNSPLAIRSYWIRFVFLWLDLWLFFSLSLSHFTIFTMTFASPGLAFLFSIYIFPSIYLFGHSVCTHVRKMRPDIYGYSTK